MIYIYGLYDPRNNELRYIGKTVNLKNRYYSHNLREITGRSKFTKKEKFYIKSEYLRWLKDNSYKSGRRCELYTKFGIDKKNAIKNILYGMSIKHKTVSL